MFDRKQLVPGVLILQFGPIENKAMTNIEKQRINRPLIFIGGGEG